MTKKLNSSKEYSLSEIFSEDMVIVIPDMQRDYCWGSEAWSGDGTNKGNYRELVSGFIDNLIELKEAKSETATLGLIYGYYEDKNDEVYLCDGQQRITTLYLLLGMLYRNASEQNTKQRIKNSLICGEPESPRLKSPRLKYAIRESTLNFLEDVVHEFFLKEGIASVKDIKGQDWYFNEYEQDPSVQSMLGALTSIEKKLNDKPNFADCFAGFILEKINVIFYDMGSKENGEETFVIINTTGEPLSGSENIKPLLLGELNEENIKTYSAVWEKWEHWFWNNRLAGEETADNGLEDFFGWYWQIKEGVDIADKKSMQYFKRKDLDKVALVDDIDKYFEQLKKLSEYIGNDSYRSLLKRICNKDIEKVRQLTKDEQTRLLLPMLHYMVCFPNDKEAHRLFFRRLRKNWFDDLLSYRQGNAVDWRNILKIIDCVVDKKGKADDVLTFNDTNAKIKWHKEKDADNNVAERWFSEWDKLVRELKLKNKADIEAREDDELFEGDLTFLLETVLSNSADVDFNKLQAVYDRHCKLQNVIKDEDDAKANPQLSNLFRLFRLLVIKCNNIEKIKRVRLDVIEGVFFSEPTTRESLGNLFKLEYKVLLNKTDSDLISYMDEQVKSKVKGEGLLEEKPSEKITHEQLIKAWLTMKVFDANKKNISLSLFVKDGFAAYRDMKKNRISEKLDFSFANAICGYAVKQYSYIDYERDGDFAKPKGLSTPLAGIDFSHWDKDIDKRSAVITAEEIAENRRVIDEIIKEIKGE
ncbi:hypothetical protein RsTz2092_09560 [Deferribacterales bacterium RsTz2092]|nr:hypothetical protein AGMMS49941_04940 [Deferribacterales bacterium]